MQRILYSSWINRIIAVVTILSLSGLIHPGSVQKAYAASTGTESLTFEINSNTNQNSGLVTIHEIAKNDILVLKLKAYLEKHNSPLADYADQIVLQPQWQRALAISWVESNFGRRCHSNNCSGIGVAPGHPNWRTYATKLDWFKDMAKLMERPMYKEKFTTCAAMRGVYVVPGSDNWVRGCNQKSNELLALTEQAEAERVALVNDHSTLVQVAFAK